MRIYITCKNIILSIKLFDWLILTIKIFEIYNFAQSKANDSIKTTLTLQVRIGDHLLLMIISANLLIRKYFLLNSIEDCIKSISLSILIKSYFFKFRKIWSCEFLLICDIFVEKNKKQLEIKKEKRETQRGERIVFLFVYYCCCSHK